MSNGKGVSIQIFNLQNYLIYLYTFQQLNSVLRIRGLKFLIALVFNVRSVLYRQNYN
jgi:hypothetical protein